eukprot:7282724-Prymnesium_polylepis.1
MGDGLYAATNSTELPAATVSQFSGIAVHPGEDAAAKQDDDWRRIFDAVVSNTDAVHFIAKKPPPRLHSLAPADLSGFSAVPVPAAGDANYSITSATSAMDHNRKVKATEAENSRRK